MSQLFHSTPAAGIRRAEAAGRTSEIDLGPHGVRAPAPAEEWMALAEAPVLTPRPSPTSRLVAWTDPDSLGSEKFRALVTRLDHMRKRHEFKALQLTSSIGHEGKTTVAANLGVTLAKYLGSRVLLIEGDLHRPNLASLFGLGDLRGLNEWWSEPAGHLARFTHRLADMPLWFLAAGAARHRPSAILKSARLAEAFAEARSHFDWIVVDSTPMLPIVDANLWSKLVDGTLLVVREGVTPVKALKHGLRALDDPALIGVVVNEACEFDQPRYEGDYYYPPSKHRKSSS